MSLLLMILGTVFIGYVFFKSLGKKKNRRNKRPREEFGQTVMERTESKQVDDPLLDGLDTSKIEVSVFAEEDNSLSLEEELLPVSDSLPENDEVSVEDEPLSQVEPTETMINEFISITIMPKRSGKTFSGKRLLSILSQNHFHYGRQKIFHYHINDNPHLPSMYSIASMVEPGFFDLERMEESEYPGIVLFMMLPCTSEPLSTFEKMLTSARQLTAAMDGILCDGKRNHLTAQTIHYYRELIKENRRAQFSQQYGISRET